MRGKFRKGVREKAWEDAKGPDGKVRDPVTNKEMKFDEAWDMGHKPGYEHWKHQESASGRNLSRENFLNEYNDPSKYRPELPLSNRSHAGEIKTNDYFGP
jgi:predicted ribonuclease toxin of YeeF-YezG toxin-antitoxin module